MDFTRDFFFDFVGIVLPISNPKTGKNQYMSGVHLPDGRIIVRIRKGSKQTALKLTKHEARHSMLEDAETRAEALAELMEDTSPDEIRRLVEDYYVLYRGIYGDDLMKYLDEILCDRYAGIERETPGENRTLREQAERMTENYSGKPVSITGEVLWSAEEEDFIRDYDGGVQEENGVRLSWLEKKKIASAIKTGEAKFNKEITGGEVSFPKWTYYFKIHGDTVGVYGIIETEKLNEERWAFHELFSVNDEEDGYYDEETGSSTKIGDNNTGNTPNRGSYAGNDGLDGKKHNRGNFGKGGRDSNEATERYSTEDDAEYLKLAEEPEKNAAKLQEMVYEAGEKAGWSIRAYHGTGRADRVGTVFLPERATSGPMAFFTDNRAIAENYSREKKDTSIAYDEEYRDYYTQFRVNRNGKSISIGELWKYLPISEKTKIKNAAPHIRFDEDYEEIIYDKEAQHGNGAYDAYKLNRNKGNVLDTLVSTWLESGDLYDRESDFLKVLKLAGVNGVEYRDPYARHEKVYDTLLKIENPFSTSTANRDFIRNLSKWVDENDVRSNRKQAASSDIWDKNSVDPDIFLDRLVQDWEMGTTHAWTSIPDYVTAYLQENGYDGIKDAGGKNGGETHTVWIPFRSEQVKSADPVTYDDSGRVIPLSERFNEDNRDIRWSAEDVTLPEYWTGILDGLHNAEAKAYTEKGFIQYMQDYGASEEDLRESRVLDAWDMESMADEGFVETDKLLRYARFPKRHPWFLFGLFLLFGREKVVSPTDRTRPHHRSAGAARSLPIPGRPLKWCRFAAD